MSGKSLNVLRWSQLTSQSSRISTMQRRAFSSSPAWLKTSVVPTFTKTSSTELDELLDTIRKTIIMPGYLSERQQEFVFKPKHRKMLENDSIVANIGGEKFRLEPIDWAHTRPSPKKALTDALKLFKDNDTENIPKLLTGLHNAKTSLTARDGSIRRVAQVCQDAGREDILLACVKQAEETGLSLGIPEAARNILYSFKQKAEASPEETKKALAWSETILELLDEPKHAAAPDAVDPKKQPEVIAPVLYLATKKAEHTKDASDIAKVEEYGKRLLSIAANAQRPVEQKEGSFGKANTYVNDTVLEIHIAANAAAELLGPESKTGAKLAKVAEYRKSEAADIITALKASPWGQEKERTSVTKYESICGSQS